MCQNVQNNMGIVYTIMIDKAALTALVLVI